MTLQARLAACCLVGGVHGMPVGKWIVSLGLASLVACSTPLPPETSAFAPEPPPTPTEALLYIVRPAASALERRVARFEVDSQPVGQLHSGTYVAVRLQPGVRSLKQSWAPSFGDPPELARALSIQVRLAPAGTHYVILDAVRVGNQTRWDLAQVGAVQGEKRIERTRRIDTSRSTP